MEKYSLLTRCKDILLFESKDMNEIKHYKTIHLDHVPLKITFDADGNIWIVNHNASFHLNILIAKSEYTPVKPDNPLLKNVNELEIAPSEKEAEIFETSLMRKWSNWTPDQVFRSQKRPVEAIEGKKKKTKRGGMKQRLRKAELAKQLAEQEEQSNATNE